jgi:hypothetical protein
MALAPWISPPQYVVAAAFQFFFFKHLFVVHRSNGSADFDV